MTEFDGKSTNDSEYLRHTETDTLIYHVMLKDREDRAGFTLLQLDTGYIIVFL